MIKWSDCSEVPCSQSAELGNLRCLVVPGHEPEFRWYVLARLDVFGTVSWFPLVGASGHTSPTLDAAKQAALDFAREWVAAQAAALGMRCVDAWHVWVAAQAAALGDGWIPVGERLPDGDTKMLVLAAHPGCAPFYSTARYFLDSDRWHTDGGDSYGGITHWRELPPPPPPPVGEVEG